VHCLKIDFLEKVKGIDRRKLTALFMTYTKSYLLTKPVYAGLGHILTFHRVVPGNRGPRVGNTEIEVTPEYLEWAINYFKKRNYHFITLDELYEVLKGRKLDNRFVIFTFDDGYIDNLTYAYPIFKKHNIPFTIYVTTNFPDRKAVLWWYLLEDLILKKEELHLEIGGKPYRFQMVSRHQKELAFDGIRSLLLRVDEKEFFNEIKKIFNTYGLDIYGKTEQLALSWQQIQQMSSDPLVTIAAHTVNHLALNKLPEAAVKQEVLASKEKLESYIDSEVAHFTYPYGSGREVGQESFRS